MPGAPAPSHPRFRTPILTLLLFFSALPLFQTASYDIDLLHPPAALEARRHKLKRLVQSPNSYFMDVKCQGCFQM